MHYRELCDPKVWHRSVNWAKVEGTECRAQSNIKAGGHTGTYSGGEDRWMQMGVECMV